jgi:hypothetical protein
MRRCAALIVTWLFVSGACAEAQQETSAPSSVVRQSRDDAWWTGPMLAPSAATLPRGHFLVEHYLYDNPHGRIQRRKTRAEYFPKFRCFTTECLHLLVDLQT